MDKKEYPMVVKDGKFYRVKTGIRNYLNSVYTKERVALKAMERYQVKSKKASEDLLKKQAEKRKGTKSNNSKEK